MVFPGLYLPLALAGASHMDVACVRDEDLNLFILEPKLSEMGIVERQSQSIHAGNQFPRLARICAQASDVSFDSKRQTTASSFFGTAPLQLSCARAQLISSCSPLNTIPGSIVRCRAFT